MTMTDTEAKALALVNADNDCVYLDYYTVPSSYLRVTLNRALEREAATEARHAAELREQAERFSEVAARVKRLIEEAKLSRLVYDCSDGSKPSFIVDALAPFIIPKPDPLVEAVKACNYATLDAIEPEFAKDLEAAIEARGGKIVWGDTHD